MSPRNARAATVLTLSALALTGAALVAFGSLESAGLLVQQEAAPAVIETPAVAVPVAEVAPVGVAASAPLGLSFESAGIGSQSITPYTDEEVAARNGVNPYTMDQISWWTGGGMPGSESTTYLYGHTWIDPAVFNGLKNAVVGDGFSIITAAGVFEYEVVETFSLAKGAFGTDSRITQDQPGRVVIATCDRTPEICPTCRTVDNAVVVGQAKLVA